MNNQTDVSPSLWNYLKSWHQTSTAKKAAAGAQINLSFDEFFQLFEPRQLVTLQNAMDAQRIRYLMDANNDYAFVLTWQSYAARSTNVFDTSTACICSRLKSRQLALPQSGDTLREDHKQAIAEAMTGKEKSEDHKKAIGEANKGKSKTAWTPERKAARAKLIADKQAVSAATRKAAEQAAWARLDAKRGDA